tara:strand:- start:92 stop:733 length:642 start_codon:yes stop_codon:yes gene_type:complete
MAEKSFGVKNIQVQGSGTPTIESPDGGNLNITAANSTFSGDITLSSGKITGNGSGLTNVAAQALIGTSNIVAGITTATKFVITGGLSSQYLMADGSTSTSGGGGGGGTVSLGTFTASAGSPETLNSYTYDSAELVFEYTVFVKQTSSSKYQTQKLLVMRDGTTVTSTQYAIMYSSDLLVQLDAIISGSSLLLRATPETGINGSTTYRVKREVT